jgi:hypothetical protein
MSVCKLFEQFSALDRLPVSVRQVEQAIRAIGIEDEIRYVHDIELDPKVILGFLRREESVGDGPKRVRSTITYAKVGHELERLIATKELIHIVDPPRVRVADLERARHLIEKIVLPPELMSVTDGDDVVTDRFAMLEAMALLFPMGARNVLYKKYMAKQISLAWIADMAELPVPHVAVVMDGFWPRHVEMFTERRRRMEAERAPAAEPPKMRLTQVR